MLTLLQLGGVAGSQYGSRPRCKQRYESRSFRDGKSGRDDTKEEEVKERYYDSKEYSRLTLFAQIPQ